MRFARYFALFALTCHAAQVEAQAHAGATARSGASTADAEPGPLVQRRVELLPLTLFFLGYPELDPPRTALRFKRFAQRRTLETCDTLLVRSGGAVERVPLRYEARSRDGAIEENALAEISIDLMERIAAASAVEFDLCGFRRTLTRVGHAQATLFVAELERRREAAESPAAEPAVAETMPDRAVPAHVTHDDGVVERPPEVVMRVADDEGVGAEVLVLAPLGGALIGLGAGGALCVVGFVTLTPEAEGCFGRLPLTGAVIGLVLGGLGGVAVYAAGESTDGEEASVVPSVSVHVAGTPDGIGGVVTTRF